LVKSLIKKKNSQQIFTIIQHEIGKLNFNSTQDKDYCV